MKLVALSMLALAACSSSPPSPPTARAVLVVRSPDPSPILARLQHALRDRELASVVGRLADLPANAAHRALSSEISREASTFEVRVSIRDEVAARRVCELAVATLIAKENRVDGSEVRIEEPCD